MLLALAEAFELPADAEVTLEANPGASDAQRFADYREAGVNRLSIGVQSLRRAARWRRWGARTTAPEAVRALRDGARGRLHQPRLDFIYGVHGADARAGAGRRAGRAAALGTEHLSAYALTLEKESLAEEVPLAKQLARGEVRLPDDELVLEMQRAYQAAFAGAGLSRYEVSNYARPGFHSRHNTLYWTGGEYLALGVGATGTLREGAGAVRWSNQRSWERYLSEVEAGRLPDASVERLDAATLSAERLALGLRLTGGIDLAAAGAGVVEAKLQRLVKGGLVVREGSWLRLTARGLELHSAVAAELI